MNVLRNVWSKFARDRRGATAIEFAFLAPVFILLMLAIVDFGLLYFENSRAERGAFLVQKQMSEGWKPENIQRLKSTFCTEADVDCGMDALKFEVVPLTATSPLISIPPADNLKLVPGQTHIIRIVYPWSGLLPSGLFSYIGLEAIMTKSINVGLFFHVKG